MNDVDQNLTSGEISLSTLAKLLKSEVLPAQQVIAQRAGVSQSMVSRARSGRLVRVTRRLALLWNYANQTLASVEQVGPAIDSSHIHRASVRSVVQEPGAEVYEELARRELDQYLNDGYDPRLVAEQLIVLRKAQRRRIPGRKPRD